MKTFLLMSKSTGALVEGARVYLKDKETGLSPVEHFLVVIDVDREHDGWIVTAPKKYFAGLWIYIEREQVETELEIIGEV
jgi:hypothetical protein